MVGSVLTLIALLFSAGPVAAQTYTQMQWGMNKGVTPYAFGANINGTWRDFGTVSAAGVWSIPATNISGLGTAAAANTGTSGATIPFLNGANTWSNTQTFSNTVSLNQVNPANYAPLSVYNNNLQPVATNNGTIGNNGVCNGLTCIQAIVTGGNGSYGFNQTFIDFANAYTPVTGSINFATSSWMNASNLGSGQLAMGAWIGVNSPATKLSHTWDAASSVVVTEFNFGNRWGGSAVLNDVGSRSTSGIYLVPDVIPTTQGANYSTVSGISAAIPAVVTMSSTHDFVANMGITFRCSGTCTLPSPLVANAVYYVEGTITGTTFQLSASPGSSTLINTTGSMTGTVLALPSYAANFAEVISASIWGHQTGTGILARYNSIAPDGYGVILRGNSISATNQPFSAIKVQGYWSNGLDFSTGTFSNNQPLILGANQSIGWGGGLRLFGIGTNLGINTSGTAATTLDVNGAIRSRSYTIATLPSCSATIIGAYATVSDGADYATGTYGSAVSATGAVTRSVLCTNTAGATTYAWAYN